MSRAETSARKRRQRMENDLREVVRQARNADAKSVRANRFKPYPQPGHGALWRLLRDLERSHQRLWPLADAIGCTEEEKAMIAQVIAPHLAGMTPGNVLHRHQLGQ